MSTHHGLLSQLALNQDEALHIGVFCKHEDDRVAPVLADICRYSSSQKYILSIDAESRHLLPSGATAVTNMQDNMDAIDVCIAIGGDGTMLSAARALTPYVIPVIGVNLGRLGFLADISPDNIINQLDEILNASYHCDTRVLLQGRIYRDGKIIHQGMALNEVVMHVRDAIRMIEFNTSVDGKHMSQQRADGLVIASPTGSTAYALSGGGPILHPDLKAFVLVPICPHTLSERPMVLPATSQIEVTLCESRGTAARVSFDGQNSINIDAGDRVVINKAGQEITLIHPREFDFYKSLRSKLGWSN